MAKSRQSFRTPTLRPSEPAILRGGEGEIASADSRLYVTAVDVTSTALQVVSPEPLAVGEAVELSIYLEGQSHPYFLKGVTRWVGHSDKAGGYVLGVELLEDANAARWRYQFH